MDWVGYKRKNEKEVEENEKKEMKLRQKDGDIQEELGGGVPVREKLWPKYTEFIYEITKKSTETVKMKNAYKVLILLLNSHCPKQCGFFFFETVDR